MPGAKLLFTSVIVSSTLARSALSLCILSILYILILQVDKEASKQEVPACLCVPSLLNEIFHEFSNVTS